MRLWNFQRDIANSIGDASVERVSVLKSARVGCSSLLASVIAYHESADPCAILLLMPTESDARGVMVDDIETLFDASPSLQGLLKSPSRQPTERSTILSRQFPAGSLKVIASHAPRNLRRHSARVLLLDEVDAMEVTHEGDPVALAERRTMSFRDRKICAGSTPTEESTSAILRLYQASDMRIFEVCCPSCGGFAETPLAAYRMAGRRARSGRLQMPRLR
ncbi:MAG TPA: phage terminase large subunit family protein [Xanthobacteraceae bacterium]